MIFVSWDNYSFKKWACLRSGLVDSLMKDPEICGDWIINNIKKIKIKIKTQNKEIDTKHDNLLEGLWQEGQSCLKIRTSWRQKKLILRIRHLDREDGYFTGSEKNIPFHEIVVNLGIKIEFESIHVPFPSSIPFQPEQPTKEDNKWMGIRRKTKWPTS